MLGEEPLDCKSPAGIFLVLNASKNVLKGSTRITSFFDG